MNPINQETLDNCLTAIQEVYDKLSVVRDEEENALGVCPNQEEVVGKLSRAISCLEEVIEMLLNAGLCETGARQAIAPAPQVLDREPTAPETQPTTPPVKKRKLGLLGWLLAIGMPFPIAGPLIILFVILYEGSGNGIFLFLSILCGVAYVAAVCFIAIKLKEPLPPSSPKRRLHTAPTHDDEREQEEATAFLGGMLGGYFLSKRLNKKSHGDNARDIF